MANIPKPFFAAYSAVLPILCSKHTAHRFPPSGSPSSPFKGYDERELQKELVDKISDFLLELGEGFAYIGKEYHININGDDFYIDLLFYNLKLHSYIVIELKAEKFKPEHLGQLNFYVTAVNRELKTDRDNATIGLLICKDKNDVVCATQIGRASCRERV